MSRINQKAAAKGSQKWLQFIVSQCRDLLSDQLRTQLRLQPEDSIEWMSPLAADSYAEYQDKIFLDLLSVRLTKRSLASFWPRGGPVWDGLARTSRGDIILVEAKSHVLEMNSECRAKPQSLKLIKDSLASTAEFYGARSLENWTRRYYQYANRLAHLHLLRNLNDIPAWLCFVYFINDSEMAGPKSEAEWRSAIRAVHEYLGISEERLPLYVIDNFVDVAKFENKNTVHQR